jgi:alpha-galactosidase
MCYYRRRRHGSRHVLGVYLLCVSAIALCVWMFANPTFPQSVYMTNDHNMATSLFSLAVGLLLQTPAALSSVIQPSVSPRPPMGFNNWARFMCDLNQTLITTTADSMKSRGLLAAGYNHVNIDDCWPEYNRTAQGKLTWNTTLFPKGIPWLADYVHDRGFKFGIYEDAGTLTCGGYPGSKGHEDTDVQTFADWGVDYVKVDGCNVLDPNSAVPAEMQFQVLYEKWHSAIQKIKEGMIFSQSAPAYFSPDFQAVPHSNNTDWYLTMDYVRKNGELARHSNDIKVYEYLGEIQTGHWDSIMTNYNYNTLLARYQQQCGFYNDPDFLIPNVPDLTMIEQKSHFALWSTFSAPLIISSYIPQLTKEHISYLTRKEILDIDQDALCRQATLASTSADYDVLTKDLADGTRLVTILNKSKYTKTFSIPLTHVGLPYATSVSAVDLWSSTSSASQVQILTQNKHLVTKLRTHETAMYKLATTSGQAQKRFQPRNHPSSQSPLIVIPTGAIYNTFTGSCLTAPTKHNSHVHFANCTASETQIWQFHSTTTPPSSPGSTTLKTDTWSISPLSDTEKCLDASAMVGPWPSVLVLKQCPSQTHRARDDDIIAANTERSILSKSSHPVFDFETKRVPYDNAKKSHSRIRETTQTKNVGWKYSINGFLGSYVNGAAKCIEQDGDAAIFKTCGEKGWDANVVEVPTGVLGEDVQAWSWTK